MKKLTIYLVVMIAVFSFTSCSKKKDGNNSAIEDFDENSRITITATPTQTEQPLVSISPVEENREDQMRSYLSGEWVPKEIGMKRPLAIQFSNFKTVSNQWGIGQADIVYECIVEGGITRLLGIGENYSGDRIGSVRSSRHYFVSLADEYNAIYIHYGKTKYATSKMKELGIDHMDGSDGIGTTVFYRDNTMKAPHNAFASLEGIEAGIKKKGFSTEYKEGYEPHYTFYDGDTDLTSEQQAKNLTLKYSAYVSPSFEYKGEDKLYYRYQFGKEHKDSLTGKQLAFKNIIIQFVKQWDIDKNDYQTMDLTDASGTGYYITNGKMIRISWKKKEATKWMRYYNEAGEELTINPGKTFIALFPRDRTKDVVLGE